MSSQLGSVILKNAVLQHAFPYGLTIDKIKGIPDIQEHDSDWSFVNVTLLKRGWGFSLCRSVWDGNQLVLHDIETGATEDNEHREFQNNRGRTNSR